MIHTKEFTEGELFGLQSVLQLVDDDVLVMALQHRIISLENHLLNLNKQEG